MGATGLPAYAHRVYHYDGARNSAETREQMCQDFIRQDTGATTFSASAGVDARIRDSADISNGDAPARHRRNSAGPGGATARKVRVVAVVVPRSAYP
ncbi:hypothetical protein F4560_003034 [Saccharothrix ecbatanensis]|uniref:Uncharacterized protein n=1 Tax=Saccharothrix ecbatanensis TaxID=1105145 RepID=A0A7W9HJK9_9PSEU|nr:hypothetical protein [Saccharothrix ecbatanensis]